MIVYIWCRRNPYVRYNFFGLFTFQAPYLPWILVLISVLFGGSVSVDLIGQLNHCTLYMYIVGESRLFSCVYNCLAYHISTYGSHHESTFRVSIEHKLEIVINHSYLCSGIGVGHMYYFLEDVFPNSPGGFKILRTPGFM